LPRYLLPALPYFYIIGAWSLTELVKSKSLQTATGIAITVLLIYSLSGTVSYGNYEWNMKYLEVVKMHKVMCEYIEEEFPNARILTIFPHVRQLGHPYLGYVKKPLKVINFKEGEHFGDFDLILFSIPSDHDKEMLRDYAVKNSLRLIKRLENDEIISELYSYGK
jgi:hypothetical protein